MTSVEGLLMKRSTKRTLCLGVLFCVVGAANPRAHAKITVVPKRNDASGFAAMINGILGQLRSSCSDCFGDQETKNRTNDLDGNQYQVTIRQSSGISQTVMADENHSKCSSGGAVDIFFNPDANSSLSGAEDRSCSTDNNAIALAHELAHAWMDVQGINPCGSPGDNAPNPTPQEVDASRVENNFRRCLGVCTRENFDGHPLPRGNPANPNTGQCFCCACDKPNADGFCAGIPGCQYDSQVESCYGCPCDNPGSFAPGVCKPGGSRTSC
jgi:hypothetical protein